MKGTTNGNKKKRREKSRSVLLGRAVGHPRSGASTFGRCAICANAIRS